MINTLNLFWIIPLAAMFGFATCAILTVGKISDNDSQSPSP